jgi:hypothetical protein
MLFSAPPPALLLLLDVDEATIGDGSDRDCGSTGSGSLAVSVVDSSRDSAISTSTETFCFFPRRERFFFRSNKLGIRFIFVAALFWGSLVGLEDDFAGEGGSGCC